MNESQQDCPFCFPQIESAIIESFGSVVAVKDKYPASDGHLLVITKRHITDIFTMTETEKQDALKLIMILKEKIMRDDPSVTGFNVGMNCGASAGQTIMHAHIHLIPRRDGDVSNPEGGIRGAIPHRMSY
jgi:diadenosine tetraphosphate (Ap4A) HIT family hydrolase